MKLAINGGEPLRKSSYPQWPVFDEKEKQKLNEVLESRIWGVGGEQKTEFEKSFAAYHQAKYCITCVNGTAAIKIALKALGIGGGDEVIIPPYTFIGTATAVLAANAIPIFVDIDSETYCLSPLDMEKKITPRTKAIIPVHIGGQPCDMRAIIDIAQKHHLSIVEDAAQAHGSEWENKKVGALGDLGCFSFQSSKNVTAGEGGAILTNSEELFHSCFSYQNCGRKIEGEWYEHIRFGLNERMSEFQAAILIAQLQRLDEQMSKREENARYLDTLLSQIDGVKPLANHPGVSRHAYHLYIFKYDSQAFGGLGKNKFVAALQAEGIPASIGYPVPLYQTDLFRYGLQQEPCFKDFYREELDYSGYSCPSAEKACREALWLPQNVLLGSKKDMDDIAAAILKIKENLGEIL